MSVSQTIVAIATSSQPAGIGIVRLSGEKALEILNNLWKTVGKSQDKFVSHRLYYGNIVDFATGEKVDEAMAVYMQEPKSYTGEDVVEFHAHGNPVILQKIVEVCLKAGARMAGPGEFTKRAYLNGKMDLAQAEAVADLIASSGEEGVKQAGEQLQGRLSQRIGEMQQELTRLRAFVEAAIDFPEEDIELIQKEGIAARLAPICTALNSLLATYHEGRLLREGVRTVLVGRPNAGKSSLMNALLGHNRAIVHHQAGTTRDVIEEVCLLNGISFRIFDTAGLRDAHENEVEAIGIERSREQLRQADLILCVIDGTAELNEHDRELISLCEKNKTIFCVNKSDLGLKLKLEFSFVSLSALQGNGLNELKEKMAAWVKQGRSTEGEGLRIASLRHKQALEGALRELNLADEMLKAQKGSELIAFHLKEAHAQLGLITGNDIQEDLLDSIFKEFCLGK